MILVFEGVDKSGKTTLKDDVLKLIKADTSIPQIITFKLTKKPTWNDPDTAYLQYKAIFDLSAQNPNFIYVLDRSYISELVYSGVKRDYDAIDDERYDEFARRTDVLLVYVETKEELLRERFVVDKEEYVEGDEITKLQDRYLVVLGGVAHERLVVETPSDRDENAHRVVDKLTEMIHEHK